MTRIANVDQVLLLLREQLQRASDAKRAAKNGARERIRATAKRPLDRARALATLDGLNEEEVRRVVVRGILMDEFGESVGNDAAFQAVVEDVVSIIGRSPGGTELMARAIAQLKEGRA